MRRRSHIVATISGALALAWIASAQTQTPPQPAKAAHAAPPIEIVACVVYPQAQPAQTVDCTDKARAACKGLVSCDLPIGLGLTDGRQIDGNERAWKKVRVSYRCGAVERVNGPHHQSEHATMQLHCAGGF